VRRPSQRFQPLNFVFGLMMGAADIVPGVSGGTVALIVGIYEGLIGSVRAVATAVVSLLRGRVQAAREATDQIDWGLVLPLGVGIVVALVVGARLILPVLETYPVQFRALFFGLIAASIAIPWRRIESPERRHYVLAAAAAIGAFALVGIPPRELIDPPLIAAFLVATIAICAMILPGVSGSFLLLVMGMYEPTLRALNAFDIPYVAAFVAGAAVGLGSFSKLLHFLLRRYHDATMAALVGLMAGSLRALWPYQDQARSLLGPPSARSFLIVAALAAVGFLLVVALTRLGASLHARRAEDARVER
jgi:putative membrane protein